jgi:hypothetical protein
MPDHWEFAAKHAAGEYVLVLTDRFVMRPSALAVLKRLIEESSARPEIIAWHAESRFDVSGKVFAVPYSGATSVHDTRALVTEFASCRDWKARPLWSNRLPRGLNSAYSRALAERVRAAHGRLYFPLTPDYTAAFLLLTYAKQMTYADLPLYLSHGNAGNGLHFAMHDGNAYLRTLGDIELFPDYCISQMRTNGNLIIRDLLFVKQLAGAVFPEAVVDRAGYLLNTWREILYMRQIGSQRDLEALRAEWWSIVEASGEETMREVRAGMAELAALEPSLAGLRRWVVRTGIDTAYHAVRRAGIRAAARLRGEPLYANALDAAAGTDSVLRGAS